MPSFLSNYMIAKAGPQHGNCTCTVCKGYWKDFPKHPYYAFVFAPYNANDESPF